LRVPHENVKAPPKRSYDASRRQQQARQLRVAIVDAARELFVTNGYAATTLTAVAHGAGVSTQLIYAAFGGKRGLLATVLDWTIVGDDEPIAMMDRPTIRAVRDEPTAARMCARFARHQRLVSARVAPTMHMLRAAADADPDARVVLETNEDRRRLGMGMFVADLRRVGRLRDGLTDDAAADAVWALAPDVLWTALVSRRGWSAEDFEEWMAVQIAAAVLPDSQLGDTRRAARHLRKREPVG
jgi:AcrR family transcriptional regulator